MLIAIAYRMVIALSRNKLLMKNNLLSKKGTVKLLTKIKCLRPSTKSSAAKAISFKDQLHWTICKTEKVRNLTKLKRMRKLKYICPKSSTFMKSVMMVAIKK